MAAFKHGFEELPNDIRTTSIEEYQLGIPLNLSPGIPFDELGFVNYQLEQVERGEWTQQFAEPALRQDSFADKFEAVPNTFETDHTYWVFEYESRHPQHVLEVAGQYLGVILGQLIYFLFDWSHTNQFDGEILWNKPWSELRFPFVYILRGGDGFHGAYFDDDISPRHTIEMFPDR